MMYLDKQKKIFILKMCVQEMDEHMRSMLHHRELEKLKGRWVVSPVQHIT